MPFNDQEFRDHLVSSLATITTTQQSMKESMDKGFNYFKEQGEKVEAALSLKADEKDVKELEDKHHELDKRVTWIRATSAAISTAVGIVIAGATAWWTRH